MWSVRAVSARSNDGCASWSACLAVAEIILKEALDVARVKKPTLPLPSWNGRKNGSQ